MTKRALVVGINDYSAKGYGNLKWCVADANSMSQLLVHGFGFDPSEVYLLTDGKASRGNILRTLRYILSQAQAGDVACFYFSGHGAPDFRTGRAFLVPSDGDPKYLRVSGYPLSQLYEKLSQLKARRIVVALDSCFSGAGGRSVLAKGTREIDAMVERIVPPMRARGGYIPTIDHGTPPEVPYANYLHYRRRLVELGG